MRLICLMPVRQDSWSLAASSRAVLQWCDDLIVCENRVWADPATREVLPDDPRVTHVEHDALAWDEADIRLHMLEVGRRMGGTHFALCDADEILTANLIPTIRDRAAALEPAELLRLPWLHLWRSLDQYRNDNSPFGKQAQTSVIFRDHPNLTYRPREDGYQIHQRAPFGVRFVEPQTRDAGLMHMQHVVWDRCVAKQVLQRLTEHLRWARSRSVEEINRRYRPTTDETGLILKAVPAEWWEGLEGFRELIDLDSDPWQVQEVERLLDEHGRGLFAGLDLMGF
jgi:hypothetical protein